MNFANTGLSQGQLCVFHNLAEDYSTITVYVAPPGQRDLPPLDENNDMHFESYGWRLITLRRSYGFNQCHQGITLRRIQFPLKNFVAMTIHKAMGETIGNVITKISSSQREYCLWQREQLYVIVSRVRKLEDVTFIGDKEETLTSVCILLKKTNQWANYCDAIIKSAANCLSATVPLTLVSPFRPSKIEVPSGDFGFVYQIISIKNTKFTYIGHCENMRKKLFEHNSSSSGLQNH